MGNSSRKEKGDRRISEPVIKVNNVYVAIFTYTALYNDDMSFNKGQRMVVLDKSTDWWKVRFIKSNQEGFIPSNYVVPANSVEKEEWFFKNTRRSDAENLLLLKGNTNGSFLIRESETVKDSYSLSIRDEHMVKHYKIRRMDNGGVYISTRNVFQSLHELVNHYQSTNAGLCQRLTDPCRSVTPAQPFEHNTWEIDRRDLKDIAKLGSGQFGEVWLALYKQNMKVAVKKLREGSMSCEAFLGEANIMKTLRHERLVQLYAVVSSEPILIITEYMEKGSMLDFLRSEEGKEVRIPRLILMAAEVADGMHHLEKMRYVHRDLRAANVLVNSLLNCKVADFGLTRIVEDNEYTSKAGTKFPIRWTSPEAMHFGHFTTKSDVWSFGVLLTEMITYGKIPYAGMSHQQLISNLDKGFRMPCPVNCPSELYDQILQCWNEKAEERPTFEFLQDMLYDFHISTEAQYQ
ncbi:unnamed protein product [Lampetra planeri]